ncbi:MAG: L-2-hydroxyglutarate oxidase [Actinomycetota bacterium]|jgi:L-2-hydroxyglutarate oxidase LhgO
MEFDFVVIGGGVVGMAIARELKNQIKDSKIAVIEKESHLAAHASGRNSGVLHAGFYYSPDSLKAKLTRDGNRLLRQYCLTNGLALIECGKVVVAQDTSQIPALEKLYSQGKQNGVELELVDEKRLQELEPFAKTHQLALWSPSTAVADPKQVAQALEKDLISLGVSILTNSPVERVEIGKLRTKTGQEIRFKHVINASGLYSDRIAKKMGFGSKYTMLPFIGLYHYAPELKGTLKRHIYPVPDARNPFLGVHFTRTAFDDLKVGPTAIPVLSREQYAALQGLNLGEFAEILANYPRFFFSKNHDVVSLMRTELPKLSRRYLLAKAHELSDRIDVSKFIKPGKPGIRAQLFDKSIAKLEMDFVIEGDSNSTHVLNAVSPGWTTCLSFAEYVVADMKKRKAI